jgi:hypothetical protein
MRLEEIDTVRLSPGDSVTIKFTIPDVRPGKRIGFGGWFRAPDDTLVRVEGEAPAFNLSLGKPPAWRKFGSQWVSDTKGVVTTEVKFEARQAFHFGLYGLGAGHVSNEVIDGARPELLRNMWRFSPEANFYPEIVGTVEVGLSVRAVAGKPALLALKSCNRCGRFLPVNLPPDERSALSFTNHCIADAPCKHPSFGRIYDADDPGVLHTMNFGFQLECRYCKKFFVNAALNPQRTPGQMKEDGARRRAFELLLEHLHEGSPQLNYKGRSGGDLAADVFDRFGGACFKCGKKFDRQHPMNLDHTRPLALLWPLDEHATALCKDHNSQKRDRTPNEFYSDEELRKLAKITRLHLKDLRDSTPNVAAIELLGQRLDWFFGTFIPSGELDKVREGKVTAALLVKALQKAIDKVPGGAPYNIVAEARRRGIR